MVCFVWAGLGLVVELLVVYHARRNPAFQGIVNSCEGPCRVRFDFALPSKMDHGNAAGPVFDLKQYIVVVLTTRDGPNRHPKEFVPRCGLPSEFLRQPG